MFKPTKKFIFVLRHVVFAALSIFFLESWHADFGVRTDVERRAFSYANHVSASLVADSYGDIINNGPFFPKARLVNYDTVQFVYLTPEDGPQVKTLCFGSDILPDVLWRFWVVMLLFLFICPFESYSVGVRLCMALVSGVWCCFFFLCRAVILGELSHGIDIVAYFRLIDIPLRAILLLSVWIVALLTARILKKVRTSGGRTASRTGGVVPVLVLLCLLGGCGGSFSNNSVSINVTGGDGSAPYIAIVAFIAGSLISNFRNGRRYQGTETGAREAGRGGPTVKPDGAPRKLTQKDVAKLFGPPCNADMVANWESFVRTNGARGCTPPVATVEGRTYTYSQGFRTNPTPESMERLGAIVRRFRETTGVQDGIKAGMFVHPRSEESLYRSVRNRPNP